jgi:predicted DNA-binding transcriptional regulator AlpA
MSTRLTKAPAGSVPATLESFDRLPGSARITTEAFCLLASCSRTTLWRRTKAGSAPVPIRQSPNVIRWRVSDVRDYLAGSVAT